MVVALHTTNTRSFAPLWLYHVISLLLNFQFQRRYYLCWNTTLLHTSSSPGLTLAIHVNIVMVSAVLALDAILKEGMVRTRSFPESMVFRTHSQMQNCGAQ